MSDSALSMTAGPTDQALLNDTIGENLQRTVSLHREREALVSCHQNIRWTWGEFHDRVRRLARGLMALGLNKGDRLGLW